MTDDSEQERWTDEAVAREIDSLAQHYPTDTLNRRLLEQAVDRLRGGEGERLREAKISLDGFQRDPLHALDLVAECAEHTQMQAAASSVAVVRAIRDRLSDALSPTDGEEGPGYGCRICERPTDGVTICRYCDRMMQAAAPDTEGREAALVKASEFHEGPYTHLAHRGDGEAVCGVEVVAWGDEPDPDAAEPICAECLRQIPRPEEAGGEDEPDWKGLALDAGGVIEAILADSSYEHPLDLPGHVIRWITDVRERFREILGEESVPRLRGAPERAGERLYVVVEGTGPDTRFVEIENAVGESVSVPRRPAEGEGLSRIGPLYREPQIGGYGE